MSFDYRLFARGLFAPDIHWDYRWSFLHDTNIDCIVIPLKNKQNKQEPKNSKRNAKRRANRRATKIHLNESTDKLNNQSTDQSIPTFKLVPGCIIKMDEFHYHYLGTLGSFAQLRGCKPGTFMSCGPFASKYDPNCDDYLRVRAVIYYDGNYYYIPSSFSLEGISSPKRHYVVVSKPIYDIQELETSICKKICPGFLD